MEEWYFVACPTPNRAQTVHATDGNSSPHVSVLRYTHLGAHAVSFAVGDGSHALEQPNMTNLMLLVSLEVYGTSQRVPFPVVLKPTHLWVTLVHLMASSEKPIWAPSDYQTVHTVHASDGHHPHDGVIRYTYLGAHALSSRVALYPLAGYRPIGLIRCSW